jgi:hypothetical protein
VSAAVRRQVFLAELPEGWRIIGIVSLKCDGMTSRQIMQKASDFENANSVVKEQANA